MSPLSSMPGARRRSALIHPLGGVGQAVLDEAPVPAGQLLRVGLGGTVERGDREPGLVATDVAAELEVTVGKKKDRRLLKQLLTLVKR